MDPTIANIINAGVSLGFPPIVINTTIANYIAMVNAVNVGKAFMYRLAFEHNRAIIERSRLAFERERAAIIERSRLAAERERAATIEYNRLALEEIIRNWCVATEADGGAIAVNCANTVLEEQDAIEALRAKHNYSMSPYEELGLRLFTGICDD